MWNKPTTAQISAAQDPKYSSGPLFFGDCDFSDKKIDIIIFSWLRSYHNFLKFVKILIV